MDDVTKSYQGYFSVTIPENLFKLINGDVLKLRDSVTEFSKFLGVYGETTSEVHLPFYDKEDETSWLYYRSLSFAFPDNKIIVGITSGNEKIFRQIQEGIIDGKFELVLRGTAKVSKNDIEGLDKEIVKVTIKKIEGFWKGNPHSSSPDVDRVVNVNNKKKNDKTNEPYDSIVKIIKNPKNYFSKKLYDDCGDWSNYNDLSKLDELEKLIDGIKKKEFEKRYPITFSV